MIDAGVSPDKLKEDMMRFPSILATPPDRIRGWQSLLHNYGIALEPELFGSMLRKASYMFYINPPLVFDEEKQTLLNQMKLTSSSTSTSGSIAYSALQVLELFRATGMSVLCVDRVVRSSPMLLLENSELIKQRLSFLHGLLLEHPSQLRTDVRYSSSSSSIKSSTKLLDTRGDSSADVKELSSFTTTAQKPVIGAESVTLARNLLDSMLYSYPDVINIDIKSVSLLFFIIIQ